MPHVSFLAGKPIHERTGWELITGFVIAPILIAGLIMGVTAWMIAQHHNDFSPGDWFGVAWVFVIGPLLIIGLPATAWREWQRRKQFGHKESGG